MNVQKRLVLTAVATIVLGVGAIGAQFSDVDLQKVQQIVNAQVPAHMGIGKVTVKSLAQKSDTIEVNLSESFADIPFTPATIET